MYLLFAVILTISGCALSAPTNKDEPQQTWLLDGKIVPESYIIKLTTKLDTFNQELTTYRFEGQVAIYIKASEAFKEIKLHQKDLDFRSVELAIGDGSTTAEKVDFDKLIINNITNIFTIPLSHEYPAGRYLLKIEYSGVNSDDMHGFYRSYYTVNDVKRWLLTTQFESSDARRAFPCFDEPKYKARYTISVQFNKSLEGYHVLSNTPLDTKVEVGDMIEYNFKPTSKKISSYLIAFIVSDFVPTETATFSNGKEYKTWGRAQFINDSQGDLSQQAGVGALEAMEKLTGVEYGFEKVDQVGIPDFSAGAMENWGLVTYRERMLFYPEDKGSTALKQSDVTTTTHELAHQWFGDLVTLHSWEDIWLNEGFATFFEYHAAHKINASIFDTSEWRLLAQFVVDELQNGAFEIDGLNSARPLTSPVTSAASIDANFDDIAYAKGGSVIRMINHVLGDDTFYAGLYDYLTANSEGTGSPESLLKAFDGAKAPGSNSKAYEKIGFRPSTYFKGWHTNAGYPVLTVNKIDESLYEISQNRFLFQKVDSTKDGNTNWNVPITYSTNLEKNFENTKPSIWLLDSATSVQINVTTKPDWIILNNQQTGYYRVNYDEENWQKLVDQLKSDRNIIDEINRAQIIDDAMSLARSTSENYLNYTLPFEILQTWKNEKEYVPWKAALNKLSFLNNKLAGSDAYASFKALVLELVEDQYNTLTLDVKEDDSHLHKLLRTQIVSWACKMGHEDCVANATNLLEQELNKKVRVNADVRSTVFCTGIRQNSNLWDDVWTLYEASTDNIEQTMLISALGCTNDEKKLNEYLTKTITENSGIRKQDSVAVFQSVYNGNPDNVPVALTFLTNNLDEIAENYGGLNPISSLVTGIAAKLSTEGELKQMKELKEKISASENEAVKAAVPSAQIAVDIVTSNQEWMSQKQESINTWLIANYSTGGASTVTVSLLAIFACVAMIFAQ